MGEEKLTSGDIEAKIQRMRKRVDDRLESSLDQGSLPAFLDDLRRNLDEISASLEVQRATSAGEAAFRQMLSHSPDCLFLQDRDLRYTWFSQECLSEYRHLWHWVKPKNKSFLLGKPND